MEKKRSSKKNKENEIKDKLIDLYEIGDDELIKDIVDNKNNCNSN